MKTDEKLIEILEKGTNKEWSQLTKEEKLRICEIKREEQGGSK